MGSNYILNKPLFSNGKIAEEVEQYFKMKDDEYDRGFQKKVDFNEISFSDSDEDVKIVLTALENNNYSFMLSKRENKAVACFVASAIGDALGIHAENEPLSYNSNEIADIQGIKILMKKRKRCELGEISSDTTFALCLADSLFYNNFLNPQDLAIRFFLAWHYGYNNCRKGNKTLAIGVTTHEALESIYNSYVNHNIIYSQVKEKLDQPLKNNGNGSIMRLAPLPICFSNGYEESLEKGIQLCMENCKIQSMTTHNGKEAYECCKILSYLIIRAINYSQVVNRKEVASESKTVFENFLNYEAISKFTGELEYSVEMLVKSQCEDQSIVAHNIMIGIYDPCYNVDSSDRDWNWKNEKFRYSPKRSLNPNSVGSYCMDCLAMALHIVYFSKSTKEAIFKAINIGGDANTLACVVGMLAGSIWGLDREVLDLYEFVRKYDNSKCAVMAYLLFKKDFTNL